MRPLSRFRDPAPSRGAYRLQRLMLTPAFRVFLRVGLPLGCIALAAGIYLSDEARRDALIYTATDMRRQIEDRPEFMVNLMSITGASQDVALDLREIIPIDFPVTSFDLDLEQIRARAEELDAVASARVHVRSGGVLEIAIEERSPAVVWRAREALELLDTQGHRVAALSARTDRADLPLLAGEGAQNAVPEALELMQVATLIAPRIRGLLRVGERRWDVILDRDQRIMLPEEGAVSALEQVIAMDQARQLLARDVAVIDMRNPDRPTLRMGGTATEIFRESRQILTTTSDQ
ncbi:MAG: cell division protein FtsQ/DivIB [Pseudomonadota bacterium]